MADTETIEREETLELIDTSEMEKLGDENVEHIGCCMWVMYVMTGRKHYAVCGVELEGPPSGPNDAEKCPTCVEIWENAKGHLCPMAMFGRGL